MKIHVLLSPQNVDELYFKDKTTVVIDVLRATTTIITALSNGAREVIPVNSVEFAMKVSNNAFGGQTLLGGERNTKKIDGFTFGNSPLEYKEESVKGKSIILFTTNGSKAVVKAKFSENLFMCSFNNLNTVAEHLVKLGKNVEILCSAFNGMFCVEDTVCAGKLIDLIIEKAGEQELTDAAKASMVLADKYGTDVYDVLYNCEHGRKLRENGFEDDINYSAQLNNIDAIPAMNAGVVKLLNSAANVKKENDNGKN